MRLAPLIALTLLLSACPQSQPAGETAAAAAAPAASHPRIAMAFAGTESDPWTAEIASAMGASLGIDVWASAGQSGHLDTYGPYECSLDGQPVSIAIVMCGMAGISDMLSQQALGEELRKWIEEQKPAAAWLDGDQLQLFAGREMDSAIPVVFTGAVADQDVYYQPGRSVTGVYKRHSLPGVMNEIWQRAPKATHIALLGDGGPASEGQLLIFQSQLEMAYFKDQPCIVGERVDSWAKLREQLQAVAKTSDGIIICGVGGPGGEPAFERANCPPDILEGISQPVVALGPSPLDHSGAVVLSLKPVEHVKYALLALRDVLRGKPAKSILPVTPPEMEVFRSESEPASPSAATP